MTSQNTASKAGFEQLFADLLHRRRRFRQFLGIVLVIFFTLLGRPDPNLFPAGVVLVVLGIVIRLWASGYIKKDKELATHGPYAFVRHPLYVGNLLLSIGFCLASGLWWSYLAMLVLWLGFYPTTIRHEDAKLQRLFGEAWETWRARTKALIPSLTPYRSDSSGQWSFAYSLMRNGEPIIALFLLGCLYYLHAFR